MNSAWRLFLTALQSFMRLPESSAGLEPAQARIALKLAPLVGAIIGAVGGLAYWIGTQFWPASVAVILSMAAVVLIQPASAISRSRLTAWIFFLLIRYNALMALSAASLPFALPPNFALGVILICAQAASRALVVSVMASRSAQGTSRVTPTDLAFALGLGLAPAALLGLPGLMGLLAAILVRLALGIYLRRQSKAAASEELDMIQQVTEISFYLGALATWNYL
jgi:adenosylcobinamide-GDP ribazoletransferase